MGGGDWMNQAAQADYYDGIQEQIQKSMPQQDIAYTEIPSEPEGIGHEIVHMITENGGVWWLLGLAALGGAGLLKKRIKKWLGISEKKK